MTVNDTIICQTLNIFINKYIHNPIEKKYTIGKLCEWENERTNQKENDVWSHGGVLAPASTMLMPEGD